MDVLTSFGICKNVDINHIKEYLGGIGSETSCFMFSNYIIDNGDKGYLLFGFEVWHNKNNEFHFFVEEGFEDGSADTYKTDISRADELAIKQIYDEYISRK